MLKEEVDVLSVLSFYGFLEKDDVGMSQLGQEHYLSVHSLGIGGVCKGIEVFLQRFYFIVFSILDSEHMTIGPTAQFLYNLESG